MKSDNLPIHGEFGKDALSRKNPSLHIHNDDALSFVWLFNGHGSQR